MAGASGMLALGMFNKASKKPKKQAKTDKKMMKPVAMKKGGMAKGKRK
jgi:hypothetical protein